MVCRTPQNCHGGVRRHRGRHRESVLLKNPTPPFNTRPTHARTGTLDTGRTTLFAVCCPAIRARARWCRPDERSENTLKTPSCRPPYITTRVPSYTCPAALLSPCPALGFRCRFFCPLPHQHGGSSFFYFLCHTDYPSSIITRGSVWHKKKSTRKKTGRDLLAGALVVAPFAFSAALAVVVDAAVGVSQQRNRAVAPVVAVRP